MKRILLTGMLCLASVFAAETSRLDLANRKFHEGDITGAAAVYQEILDTSGPSAAVLFNLGNCEQRLGKYGPAILAYERARLLTPRDPDLRANLVLARKAAAVFDEPGRYPRVEAFFAYLSLNEWSWLVAAGALLLGGLAVLRGSVWFPRRWMVLSVRSAAGMAVFFVVLGSCALYLRRDEKNRGVVISENAVVRLSPFEKAESLRTAGQGGIVRMLKTEGGFHYVEVPGTELRGWMSDKDVSAIMR